MKKVFLLSLSLSLIALSTSSHAQLSAEPNPAVNTEFSWDEFDVVANSFVTNNFGTDVEVTWMRNVINLPDDWDSAVCDKIACHFHFVGEGSFEMSPSETSNIDVHVYNWDATEGSAFIEVDLIADAAPTDTLTVVFIFDNALNTVEQVRQHVKVYPNPTTDVVWLESPETVVRVEIFDLSGRLVREANLFGNERASLAGFPAGKYIIRSYGVGDALLSANVVTRL